VLQPAAVGVTPVLYLLHAGGDFLRSLDLGVEALVAGLKLSDLPVDEAIPMVFRMGTDSDRIKNMLTSGADFRDGLCRRSYGVSLDEPVSTSFEKQRRVYIFNARSWTRADVTAIEERFGL
jgi:hypothetical protein